MTAHPAARWLLALAALLALLAAAFPAAVAGGMALDGGARLLQTDPLYAPGQVFPPDRVGDVSTETQHLPWDRFIMRSWARGEAPLWMADAGFGVPLAANGQSAPYSPFKALLLGRDGAWGNAFVLGRLAVAGAGMLALAAFLGLSPAAGALAAIALMLDGYFLAHLRFPDVHAYMMLPWLVLAAGRLRRRPDARGVALLGGAIGLTGLLGHPEHALYAAAGAALVFLAGPHAAGRRRAALALAAAAALAAGIAAVMVLPFAQFVTQSTSYLFGDRHDFALGFPALAACVAGNLLTPLGPRSAYEAYVGVLPLLLAGWGLAHPAVRRPGLVLVALGLACYGLLPPSAVVPTLPLLPNSFYASPLVVMGLALLAAGGAERWLAAPRGAGVRAVALAALALAGAAAAYHAAGGTALGDLGATRGWALAAAIAAGASALRAWPRGAIAAVLLALTAGDLVGAARAVVVPLPPFDFPATPIVARLRAEPGHPRVATYAGPLPPNTGAVHGIATAQVSDPFLLRRHVPWRRALDAMDPDALDVAGVRFLLVGRNDWGRDPIARFGADPARYPLRLAQPGALLYENTTALPRARVVHRAAFMPTDMREAPRRATAEAARWRAAALIETPDGAPPAGWADTGLPPSAVAFVADGDREVVLTTRLAAPGFLVLADSWYPGWQATVDGREAAIYPADGAFRAVLLGPGAHRVVFRFAPPTFRLGLGLTLAALALAGALLLRPRGYMTLR